MLTMRLQVANGDVFLVGSVVDVYVPITVDLYDFEGTFSARRGFGCFCVFRFLLYNEYFVSNFANTSDPHFILIPFVGISLLSVLQFQEL